MAKLKYIFIPALLAVTSWAAEIPAGTPITVRMTDPVDSKRNQIGETFRATLDEPVVVDGKTILSRGADVKTKLVEVDRGGRVTGRPEVTLALDSIEKSGTAVPASSSEVTVEGKSRTKRTGLVMGGAAALGAIIGGIAGGGKGAAIGAASGAGAGGAYQVFTKGESVKIPAETRLTFTLATPVSLL